MGRSGADGRFAGRVAIVTGAAQGLGFGIARRLAADGARVVLADIAESIHNAAAEIGGTATARVCDVADSAAVDGLMVELVERQGLLDVMVANAGCPLGDRRRWCARRPDRRGVPPHHRRQP